MPENLLQIITIQPRGVESTRKKVAGLFAAFREGADEATEAGDSVLGRIKGIGKSAKVWIAGVAVSAIAALTAGLAKAASTAIKFEENLQKVGTLIDGDVTGTLDRFAEGLDRIRQQLPVTTDLTRALYDAISAGIPEEDAIGFLDDAARAATAGMTDTKTAVDALTSALNAYGKEVEETEEISDSFFQAIEAGKTTFPELASEMGKVLPLASSLGVEIDEVNAALATLTASGRSTSEAGTELRQILNSLIKEGERFRSVGIDINEVLDERGLFGVLQRVREETGGSSQEMRKLFRRVQALNGAITLGVENNQKFADTLGLMEEKAGATDEAVQQMEKSVSSLWQTTRNQLSTLWRQLGEDVLPTLNSVLRTTVGLLDDASSTDLDRLIQTVSEMQGIDSGVEERLRAVRRLRRAEERLEEARGDRQGEIVTGVDFSTRPSTLRRGELSEMDVEELRSRLQAVNEALAERANRVAELEAKEGDLSEVQQQTLDMARRRRSLLETARKGLLEGIETLTRYEAAQKAVTQARGNLNNALSDDPAAQSGGGGATTPGGDEGPSPEQRTKARKKLLEITRRVTQEEQLRGAANEEARQALQNIFDLKARIRRIDELQNTLQGEQLKKAKEQKQVLQDRLEEQKNALEEAGRAEEVQVLDPEALVASAEETAKAFKQKLTGEIRSIQEAAGAQSVGVLGVDVEEMVSRIEEQRKRLEQGEINPAQFAEEARSIAKEYRSEIEKIIDRSVQLTTLTEEQGKRMKQGLKPARDEAQALRADFIQTIGDLQRHGEISAGVGAQIAEGIRNMSDEALKKTGSLSEALKHLKKSSEDIDSDAIDALLDALEESTEQAEDLGEALQDTARFVRGIGDLASQFGDLSDEAEAAIDSTATVLDNVGRLVELTEKEDISGLGDIFSGASSFSTTLSGITSVLGAAGGVASMVQAFLEDAEGLSFEQMKDLKLSIDENIDAIRENTKALLGEGQIGEDISPDTIEQAEALIKELSDVPYGGEIADKWMDTVERLLAQLGRLDIPGFKDFRPLFKDLTKAVANKTGFVKAGVRPEVLKLITGKMSPEEFIEHFSSDHSDADEGDIRDLLKQMIGDGFKGLKDILQQVNENLGTFSDSISGAIEELKFMRQFGDTDPMQNFASFMDTVISNATGDLKKLLQEASSLDISTEEGREQLSTIITEISEQLAAGNLDDLGEVDPNQVENLLSELQSFTKERDGGESDFNTQAAKARIITEHQANEVVSFLQELVQLSRTQRDLLSAILTSLGGEPPESPPVSESSSAPEAAAGPQAASTPGVGIPAGLQETIAAAEANGFRPPVPTGQRSMKKIVNEGQAVYNINLEINGEMSAERTARKVKKYLDEYLPRG
jgi:TP901 family phage tail tape measure protein